MNIETCAICGRKIDTDKDEYTLTEDGEYVCDYIHNDSLRTCSDCGGIIIRKPGKCRCNSCENRIYERDCNSYGTKPYPVFKNFGINHNNPIKHRRYYGLEMEFNNSDSDVCHSLGENLYLEKCIYNKRDGSISNGVEIVTSPMDLKSIKETINRMDDIFTYVKKNDYKNNAGLHIHISKDSIPIMDRYKICGLLNSQCNILEKRIMYYLSGRIETPDDTRYDDGYYRIGTSNGIAPRASGHCVALNTGNSSTYEFRLFKSSAEKDILISYIELADKMLDFCHNSGIDDITIGKFIEWLKNNTKNKVILNRISEFEKVCGKIKPCKKVTYNKFEKLIGLNWRKYPSLIWKIESLGFRTGINNLETLGELEGNYGNIEPKEDDTEILRSLKKTLKKTLISYILQNQTMEDEQCV